MADTNSTGESLLDQIKAFDPNDIDWQNMGSWPLIGKVIFCVALFFGIGAGGYFVFIQKEEAKLERLSSMEVSLKKDFETKAFRVANLDEYRTQMIEMETRFGSLLKQLPKDTEVPGLIDDISTAALNSGLDLKSIDPQDMKKTEFYKELPINIEVSGDYHEMGAFVSGVASLPRIVTLHDFDIKTASKGGVLTMNILAKTYQYDADGGE
ncbi:MAG: pilus assembly protein PilP [Oceanobacter sp.]|jgi:type IV pilus assembly protein PilO|nr:MAG: pilus assembly protein PilP [Oceanobacter sp.]